MASLGWSSASSLANLFGRQCAGELDGDVPLGQHQPGGNEALDDARTGRHDPASTQFVHQRRGDAGALVVASATGSSLARSSRP